MLPPMPFDLVFVGAGNMAEAIARGLLGPGQFTPDRLAAADVSADRRKLFEKQLGVTTFEQNTDAVADTKAVLLATKPQQVESALAGLGQAMTEKTLVISIMAGVSTRTIETALGLGRPWRVVRTMPNTPVLVGQGAVAVAPGKFATKADIAAARSFFEPAAVVVDTTEAQLDAVTALSGSGPAYVFYLIEQMTAAGIELGLPPDQADLLAKQTVLGSATMARDAAESPAELRRRVTSPKGTTQAAIEYMDAHDLGGIVRRAIAAAHDRSVELGQAK